MFASNNEKDVKHVQASNKRRKTGFQVLRGTLQSFVSNLVSLIFMFPVEAGLSVALLRNI